MRKMRSTVSIKIEMDNGDLYELERPSTVKSIEEHKPVIIVLTNGDIVDGEEATFGCDFLNVKVNDSYMRSFPVGVVFGWAYKNDDNIEKS